MSKSMEIKLEDDYLLLSGIQHFQFCKRQWALIHIEQQWDENVRTIGGKADPRKSGSALPQGKRKDVLVVRAMPICSHELRLTGVCDVVEFVGILRASSPWQDRKYVPVPVEYKRASQNRRQRHFTVGCPGNVFGRDVGLWMCLWGSCITRFAIGKIEITEVLKDKVRDVVDEMHHYFAKRHTPTVKTGNHCKNCSLTTSVFLG